MAAKMAAKSGNMTPKWAKIVVFGDGFKKSGFRPKSYTNFSVKITEIHQPIGYFGVANPLERITSWQYLFWEVKIFMWLILHSHPKTYPFI